MSNIDHEIEGQELDPFSFHNGVASRIPGLGGNAPGYDATYAFHTPYVEANPGICHFIVRFSGLRAKLGMLRLSVYMLPLEAGAQARVANSDRIQLNRLVQRGNTFEIRFEAFAAVSFALHGQITGETDVEADGLTIVLDRPFDPANRTIAPEARSSRHGRDNVKPTIHLLSTATADLDAPVSQIATLPQLEEKSFASWQASLEIAVLPAIDQWSIVFVMQAIDRYGLLQEGADGLFLGEGGATAILCDKLTAFGLSIVAPQLTSSATVEAENLSLPFDHLSLPGHLINFDFLWTDGVVEGFETFGAALRFLEESATCLRPGGLAIHLLPFDVSLDLYPIEAPGDLLFQRRHIERAAMVMISRNIEVAVIKIDASQPIVARTEDGRDISRFGMIVRRPPSAY